MDLRSKMTYANVVATLALALVIGGGSVYAAAKLGKNVVKSKQIAKGAVKGSDLAKNSVASKNVKSATIVTDDLAADVIARLAPEVTAQSSAGPQGGLTTDTPAPLPLTGTTTFTPQPGEVAAITAEGRFTYATTNIVQFCQPSARLLFNGEPTGVFVSPDADGDSPTLITSSGRDADGPYGLLDPGTPITLTATLRGDPDCTATSRLDKLEVKVVQIR